MLAKSKVGVRDPEVLFLTCQEIESAANTLKRDFLDALGKELKARALQERLPGLFEMASAAVQLNVTGPIANCMGLLSNLLAIPEMTVAINMSLAEGLRRKLEFANALLMGMVGFSYKKRTALIRMYRKLLLYGFE